MYQKDKILLIFLNWLIYLFPFFYILGNFFINLNLFLISITGLLLYKSQIFDFKKDNSIIFTFVFFLIIIIASFFENISNPGNIKFYKSIFFLRYFILLLVIRYAIINDHINIKRFFISCMIFSMIISLDVILQFITGKNIVGLKSAAHHRTSFFNDEPITGGFIQRFSILGFFLTIALLGKGYLKVIIPSAFLLICLLGVFFSGNKMPTFMLLAFILCFLFLKFIYFKTYKSKKFLFSFSIILFVLILGSEKINNKLRNLNLVHANTPGTYLASFYSFIGGIPNLKIIYFEATRDYSELNKYKGKVWFHYTEEFKNKEKYRYIIKRSLYNHIYITSLDLFLEKPMTGRGIKSFRETCKEMVHLPNRICSSHQHNYHLQLLNDVGLVGYLIFFGIFCFLVFQCFKKDSLRSNIYFYAVLSVLLIEFFPLRSSGGFFSTVNSSYIFLMIGMLYGFKDLDYKK